MTALSLTEDVLPLLRCPRCRAPVVRVGDAFVCQPEGHRWPIVLGIPDFRLIEDPLIPLADDYRKGEHLAAEAQHRSFADLVAYYWTLPTYPPTPPDLIARFVHHVQSDDRRIADYLPVLGSGGRFIDVGCGAGVLVREMAPHSSLSVGVDVGFRWLVVARRGLEESGRPVNIICANAEHLPLADSSFSSIATVALLEHVPDAEQVLSECARIATPGGRLFVSTSNRFSLAPEPHVRVWGVGFLPRRWMPAYVRWRRGMAYEKKRLLSAGELRRTASRAGYKQIRFRIPAVTKADLASLGRVERIAAHGWGLARRIPVLGGLLTRIFPVLQATAIRQSDRK